MSRYFRRNPDPQQAVVIKHTSSLDPETLGQAGGEVVGTVISFLRKEDPAEEAALAAAEEQAEEEEAGLGATPWVIGGVALVGLVGVAWAFWPREE